MSQVDTSTDLNRTTTPRHLYPASFAPDPCELCSSRYLGQARPSGKDLRWGKALVNSFLQFGDMFFDVNKPPHGDRNTTVPCRGTAQQTRTGCGVERRFGTPWFAKPNPAIVNSLSKMFSKRRLLQYISCCGVEWCINLILHIGLD